MKQILGTLALVIFAAVALTVCYRDGSITGCWYNEDKGMWEPAPVSFGNITGIPNGIGEGEIPVTADGEVVTAPARDVHIILSTCPGDREDPRAP